MVQMSRSLRQTPLAQAYERARQQGDVVRVFLGAMIGVFAVVVFTDFETTSNPTATSPIVIAFASGLAVKPIYAGIESLTNALASRLRGT